MWSPTGTGAAFGSDCGRVHGAVCVGGAGCAPHVAQGCCSAFAEIALAVAAGSSSAY